MEVEAIEKRLLKYIPKKLIPYVVWLDSYGVGGGCFVYNLTVEIDGVEESAEPADTVAELTWNAKQLMKYLGI